MWGRNVVTAIARSEVDCHLPSHAVKSGARVSDARAQRRCEETSRCDSGWNRNTHAREPGDCMHLWRVWQIWSHFCGHLPSGKGSVAENSSWSKYMPSKCGCVYFCSEASHTTFRGRVSSVA